MQKTITWENIEIEILYIASKYKFYEEIYGHAMSHIEIRCNEKLPITDTGYRSHFILEPNIREYGGVEKFIIDWLNDESKSEEWKAIKTRSDQYSLF